MDIYRLRLFKKITKKLLNKKNIINYFKNKKKSRNQKNF